LDSGIKSVLSTFGANIGNVKDYPVLSNKYFVIMGASIFSFSKISGINLYSANVKAVNYGGIDEPFLIYEPNNNFNTLKLEKGFGTANILELADKVKTFILIIKGDDNSVKGIYYTNKMMVKNIVLSDLDAGKSNVLIQTMEIAYISLRTSKKLNLAVASLSSLTNVSSHTSGESEQRTTSGIVEKNEILTEKEVNIKKNDTSKNNNSGSYEKSSYEKEREQITTDTERIKKLKMAKINNKEIKAAAKRNKIIEEENKKKNIEFMTKKEKEIEDKLNIIEL